MPADAAQHPLQSDQIDRLVAVFYARLRQDPQLGPVFAAAIGPDAACWRRHEAWIAGFWRKATGLDRSAYEGNPQQVHSANPDIAPGHFDIWLSHFRAAAEEVLAPEQAAAIHAMATRIGRGMRIGVQAARQPQGAPPVLS
ncbi:group III truncated hemoglobin [Mangrovicoccus algicola]|uniref:Group III truncated hemoglobin n=1 Tax=Mangrovicoccus algicola TaxID=2771008 RepID=A0A8J6YXP6_9RHOB|nr:group III truncated hemoglobin [Mangrovicoccus algicola]MBE3637836.1 group III truncated hemoglobin [Mangrovicoccus algicola]